MTTQQKIKWVNNMFIKNVDAKRLHSAKSLDCSWKINDEWPAEARRSLHGQIASLASLVKLELGISFFEVADEIIDAA